MKNLLLFLWQVASPMNPELDPKSGGAIALYIAIAGLLGAILKSLLDYLLGWKKSKSEIDKTQADIDLSQSTVRKNDNEIITNLQNKLLETQRLLMETQEQIDKWIKRFEKTADDAAQVEDELRDIRRECDHCIRTRKGYTELCGRIIEFFNLLEPMLVNIEESEIVISRMKKLREVMQELEAEVVHRIQGNSE